MVRTLQEYLDKKYPTEEDKESVELICTGDIEKEIGGKSCITLPKITTTPNLRTQIFKLP